MLSLEELDLTKWIPTAPEKKEDTLGKAPFDEEVKQYMRRTQAYNENRENVFTLVLGQCFDVMQAKLEGQPDWAEIFEDQNLVKLLRSVKV